MKSMLKYLAVLILIGSLNAEGADKEVRFLVNGIVKHEQLAVVSFTHHYGFTGRMDTNGWAISINTMPANKGPKVYAIGNDAGIFITFDMPKNPEGNSIQPVATSLAMVLTNTVPNTLSAPCLGPLWLTYFSSRYLKYADKNKTPPPTAMNVAGGSILPDFDEYYEKCEWDVALYTGLPTKFIAMHDGFMRGPVMGKLVSVGKYPAPFDQGFTNIIFNASDFALVSQFRLPRKATLEVFVCKDKKLQLGHRFSIETLQLDAAPDSPLPLATPIGTALVHDGRTMISNTPVVVGYISSNRFLGIEELTKLPTFKEDVEQSLRKPRLPIIMTKSVAVYKNVLIIVFIFTSALFARNILKHKKRKELSSNEEDQ